MNHPTLAEGLRVPELGASRLLPLALDDYPRQRACILYCAGRLWSESAEPLRIASPGELGWREIEAFLARRRERLDAVIFGGEEPTLQRDLQPAMQRVCELGFKVGLHSSGIHLERFRQALRWTDWVGFEVGGEPGAGAWIHWRSLDALLESGIAHEVRLNWHPQLLSLDVLETVAERLRSLGVRHLAVRELQGRRHPVSGFPVPRFTDLMRAEVRQRLARFWPELVWRTQFGH